MQSKRMSETAISLLDSPAHWKHTTNDTERQRYLFTVVLSQCCIVESTFSKLMSTKYWFGIHTAFAVYFHWTCIFHSFVGCSQHESSGRPNNLNTIHNMHVSAKSLIVSAFALNILFSHLSCIFNTFVGRLHHTRSVLSETIGVVDLLICRS